MPRYLVTLRHAETGETRTMVVRAPEIEDAVEAAIAFANTQEGISDPSEDVWHAEHACPADDAPVPGRDC